MIGSVPVHVPGLAVSVSPARSAPAIVGGESGAGGSPTSSTSSGAWPASFVERQLAAAVGIVTMKETGPAPVTALVTSISIHEPACANGSTPGRCRAPPT